MAKTNGCSSVAGPSSSPHSRRSRRPRSPPGSIVAFLATLSHFHFSVHAHPLDPPQTALPFLYPSFISQPTPTVAKRSLSSSSDATTSTSTLPPPPPTPPLAQCNPQQLDVPDKYVLGADGYWHKTEWSLYGSTQCFCPCPPTATGQDINLPDNPSSIDDFDTSSLPTGWDVPHTSSRHGMVIILSLSVALAVAILSMMIICVVWRRKLIPKKDPEKKRGDSSEFADDDASRSIREAKAAQRRWSKAVSRWRTNVRFSFRRRRIDRAVTRTATYSTLYQEGDGIVTDVFPSSSRSHSPTPTLRSRASTSREDPLSSAVSVHSTASGTRLPRASSPRPQLTTSHDDSDHPLSPIEPPAYHTPPPIPPLPPAGDHSPPYTHSDGSAPSSSKHPVPSSRSSQPNDTDDVHIGSLSGHVATDDKALLFHRAALASAPLESSSRFAPSAPSIEDDEDLEFPPESRPPSPVSEQRPPYMPPTSLLPPPPSKGKLRYEYSDVDLNYDIATIEPGLGPSAPPFEESEMVPSAPPPLDLEVPVPSAPVMVTEQDDDRQDGMHRMDTGTVAALPERVSHTLSMDDLGVDPDPGDGDGLHATT